MNLDAKSPLQRPVWTRHYTPRAVVKRPRRNRHPTAVIIIIISSTTVAHHPLISITTTTILRQYRAAVVDDGIGIVLPVAVATAANAMGFRGELPRPTLHRPRRRRSRNTHRFNTRTKRCSASLCGGTTITFSMTTGNTKMVWIRVWELHKT